MPSLTSAPAPRVVTNGSSVAKKPPTTKDVTNGSSVAKKPTTKGVKIGVWNLRSTEFTELEAPDNAESLFSGSAGESVIGQDGRKRVNKKDLMPGGKYRCKPSRQSFFPQGVTSNQTSSHCETVSSLRWPRRESTLGNGYGLAHQQRHDCDRGPLLL